MLGTTPSPQQSHPRYATGTTSSRSLAPVVVHPRRELVAGEDAGAAAPSDTRRGNVAERRFKRLPRRGLVDRAIASLIDIDRPWVAAALNCSHRTPNAICSITNWAKRA